jgi:hypothetical protein
VRFRAMAVASGHANFTQRPWRIRQRRSAAADKQDCRANQFAGGDPTSAMLERPSHGGILEAGRKKTDSSQRLEELLPGF